MAALTPEDTATISWAYTAADIDTLSLKWASGFVPAAPVAFTSESVFLAVPAASAPKRSRPSVSRTIVGDMFFSIGLVDSDKAPLENLLDMRFMELSLAAWPFLFRRVAVDAPFGSGEDMGWASIPDLRAALFDMLAATGRDEDTTDLCPGPPGGDDGEDEGNIEFDDPVGDDGGLDEPLRCMAPEPSARRPGAAPVGGFAADELVPANAALAPGRPIPMPVFRRPGGRAPALRAPPPARVPAAVPELPGITDERLESCLERVLRRMSPPGAAPAPVESPVRPVPAQPAAAADIFSREAAAASQLPPSPPWRRLPG